MSENPSLKFKISKLRCAVVGLKLGFITNSIINHLFPALGVTAEPSSSFSIASSYTFHIFLLFLTGLQVLSNVLELLNVIELELQASWLSSQHNEVRPGELRAVKMVGEEKLMVPSLSYKQTNQFTRLFTGSKLVLNG